MAYKGNVQNISPLKCSQTQWKKWAQITRAGRQRTVDDWLLANLKETSKHFCLTCKTKIIQKIVVKDMPNFIYFNIEKSIALQWKDTIIVNNSTYRLCGMIYFKDFHFTARSFTLNGDIWFHDSADQDSLSIFEGNLKKTTSKFLQSDCKNRKLSIAIYVIQWFN